MLYIPTFKVGLLDSPEPGIFFVESFWCIKEEFKACDFVDSIKLKRSYAHQVFFRDFSLDRLEEYGMLSFLAEDSPAKTFVTIYEFDENISEVCVWELIDAPRTTQ